MRAIGMISGTSFDAIDVAVIDCQCGAVSIDLSLVATGSYAYPDGLTERIRQAMPPARTSMEDVCILDTLLGQAFADAAHEANRELADSRAEVIGSHGQTLYHWVEAGRAKGSLQLGQPAWIAERCQLPVVADFRAADIAAGGHGAPLASTFDTLLLGGRPGGPRALLNLGGIANVTLVDADPPIAFDIGPANALIDIAVERVSRGRERYDANGERARRGHVHAALLAALMDDDYYRQTPPKSTGKEVFNADYLERALVAAGEPSADDLIATVTEHAARVVADTLADSGLAEVVMAGGGCNNPALIEHLRRLLGSGTSLAPMSDYGVPADAKEAVFFALYAVLTLGGFAGNVASCTGATDARSLGVIVPARHTPIGDSVMRFHQCLPHVLRIS